MQRTQLIQETDLFTKKSYETSIAEIVDYNLMQFVCFLVVIDLHVVIRNVKIELFFGGVWNAIQ